MAIDTAQKRMSAINPRCPWRGPMVAAAEAGFSVGNRQAAAFMYSGIAADVVALINYFGIVGWVFSMGGVIGAGKVTPEGLVGSAFEPGSEIGAGEVK